MKLCLKFLYMTLIMSWIGHSPMVLASGGLAGLASDGQKASYLILEAITPELLDVTTLPEAQFRSRVADFYRAHYQDLLDEAAKTPIELRVQNANHACGETDHERFSKVYLSRTECVDRVDSTGAMARLLIGEYVHHVKQGDEFSDWVKSTVIKTYERIYADDYKELVKRVDPYAIDKATNFKDVAGAIYFNSDAKNVQIFSILHDGRILMPVSNKMNETVETIPIVQQPVRWDAAKSAFVTNGEWNIIGYENRYWGQGLYERYPVWFKKPLRVEIRYVQNGSGVLVTFDMPMRIDFSRNDVVMQKVTMSMVLHPEKSVIDAFMADHKVK